jgi:protocatechuate 3,4-dioxygenase beta subunit
LTERLLLAGALLGLVVATAADAVQKQPREVAEAPAQLSSIGRIAPANEPGAPLVISGVVLAADGKTPAPGVVVYAYHTDNHGLYNRTGSSGGAGENNPRLRGWVKTDSNGHFEFTTIKPAPYPNRNVPAHVHVQAWGGGYPRQWFDVEFKGDPLLPKQHFTDNTADFLYIIPLQSDRNGILRGSVTIQMRKESNFPRDESPAE